MNTSIFAILIVGGTLPVAVQAAVLVGPVTNPMNGHQYYLLTTDTWTNAQAEAVQLGGNLVTVNDQSEQNWVFQTFAGDSGRALWIGLRRLQDGGPFEWVSGEPLQYTNWAPGEPNYEDERFVNMISSLGNTESVGSWNNDYDRATSLYNSSPWYAVHGVVEVVPGPASATLMGACITAGGLRRRRGSR